MQTYPLDVSQVVSQEVNGDLRLGGVEFKAKNAHVLTVNGKKF